MFEKTGFIDKTGKFLNLYFDIIATMDLAITLD